MGESEMPLYIPRAMKRVELKPTKRAGKNIIFDHPAVEELVFGAGTEVIGSFAVEQCPRLRRVYLPASATVEENAFAGCHPDLELIRQ